MPGGLGDSIRKGVGMVHGTGEAIRGQFNAAVDNAAGDKTSATRNQEIAQKGVDEWDRGYRGHALGEQPAQGVGHNVPPTTEHANTTHSTSTNYGPHSTNVGNKLDPRFDSDTDHRGTATTSTNAGPHSTNVGNKLDPTVDSDLDHRTNPTSGMGPNTVHPASGYDSTNAGPHRSNFANKIDPRVDSDVDHRANPTPAAGIQGAAVGNTGGSGSSNAGPHASNLGNKVDPRVDSDHDHRRNQGPSLGGGPQY